MSVNIGINTQSINGADYVGFMALSILAGELPTVTFRGRLQATRIAAAVLPPAWVFIEGDYPVDYAVNTDPTFLKPPERGGVR
jgi:hypothetical protein